MTKTGIWIIFFVTTQQLDQRLPKDVGGYRLPFSIVHHFRPSEAPLEVTAAGHPRCHLPTQNLDECYTKMRRTTWAKNDGYRIAGAGGSGGLQ